jgi:hypothetical protein
LGEQLRASLENFLVSGTIEMRERGGRVTSSQPLSWEVRGSPERPLLHLWSDNCNLTRRVRSIAAKSDDRLALAVEQFGRSKPARMEIVRVAYSRNPRQRSRFFGSDGVWEELDSHNKSGLWQLIVNFETFRNSLAWDTRHALYRAQPERWMQVNLLQDVSRIDPMLDPGHVYEQLFAQTTGRHGILDLLCVTRSRRPAILELKATENIDLPQAADYWSRIRRHQAHGDIARYGYFPGIELQPAPPIVYIVAPALRFHPSTEPLLRHLTPEMEIIRIGLSEGWRRGIRVKLRQKLIK